MRVQFIVLIICLLFCNISKAQYTFAKPPKFIFGTWKIYKYKFIGGGTLITIDKAKSYVGKKVVFDKRSFHHDQDFLWFDDECGLTKYTFETFAGLEGEVGKTQGTLWAYDVKEAQKNKIQWIKPNCDGVDYYYFEITKSKQLAIFYDHYFFFLKKVSK